MSPGYRCKWRGLPKRFGNWHTTYTCMNRWTKAGLLDRMFAQLQKAQVVRIKIEAVSLDSTSIKVHPDGTRGPAAAGLPEAVHVPPLTASLPPELAVTSRCGHLACRMRRPKLVGRRRKVRLDAIHSQLGRVSKLRQ